MRSRLFKLIDGTGQNDHRTLFVAIHDFGIDTRTDMHDFKTLLESAFHEEGLLLTPTVQTFYFHREFLASDYRLPPLPDAKDEGIVRDDSGSKGRL